MTVTASETGIDRTQGKRHAPFVYFGQRYGLLVVLAAVILFFSTYSKTSEAFPSRANLVTLIGNSAVISVLALAFVIPLTAGIIDLSAAAATGASSIATASVMSRFDGPLWLAVLAGLAVGIAVGATNGLLITRLGLDPIIETLGMSILLPGVGSAPLVVGDVLGARGGGGWAEGGGGGAGAAPARLADEAAVDLVHPTVAALAVGGLSASAVLIEGEHAEEEIHDHPVVELV